MARRKGTPPRPCGKKRLSKGHAAGVVRQARRSPNPSREEIRVYFCPGCGCWHTTKAPWADYTTRHLS